MTRKGQAMMEALMVLRGPRPMPAYLQGREQGESEKGLGTMTGMKGKIWGRGKGLGR